MMRNNLKVDLVNINAYIELCEILSICLSLIGNENLTPKSDTNKGQ